MSKVTKEVALDEFARMCEERDIDVDEKEMDEKDLEKFRDLRDSLVKLIMKGRLVVDEKGVPTLELKYPVGDYSRITWPRPKGNTLVALGGAKADKNKILASYEAMSDLTDVPVTVFEKLDFQADGKPCNALFALFLG